MYKIVKKYKRQGRLAAFVAFLLLVLFLFSVHWEVQDPPLPEEIPELEITGISLADLAYNESSNGGASSAAPSQSTQQTSQSTSAPESVTVESTPNSTTVESGTGSTTGSSSTTEASDPQPDQGLMMGSGGNGQSASDGSGIGRDGPGTGGGPPGQGTPGQGGYGNRNWVNRADCSIPNNNVGAQVTLIMTINPQGRVIAAQHVAEESTTSDPDLIRKVKQVAKDCFRFNKVSGTKNEKVKMPIVLK